MSLFNIGETVVCSVEVKNTAGVLVDPATSMTTTITSPQKTIVVSAQNMSKDSTGKYHYDYTSEVTAPDGKYTAAYKATDGTRITIAKNIFELV